MRGCRQKGTSSRMEDLDSDFVVQLRRAIELFDRCLSAHNHICSGCHGDINDPFFMRVNPNMEFHANCLKCVDCHRFLDENSTTFLRDSLTYCRDDYYNRFGKKCARCNGVCMKNELVMHASQFVFHLDCFLCVRCERRLQPGEKFHVHRTGQPVITCAPECPRPPTLTTLGGPVMPALPVGSSPAPIIENRVSSPGAGFDEDSWETSTLASGDGGNGSPALRSPKSDEGVVNPTSSGGRKKGKDKQTTRVRTVLNEAQLTILKKCYAVNARPDALIKEQLVEMTGLNARVIRVWFQNKRCKDKKRQIQLRDMQANAEKEAAMNGIRLHGVGPLIAASPTTHVDSSIGAPLEIHHFAQWAEHPAQFHPPQMGFEGQTPLSEMGFHPHAFPTPFSPHLANLSSPSCSD